MSEKIEGKVIFKIVKSKKNGKEYVVASVLIAPNLYEDFFLDDKAALIVRNTYKI